MVLKAMKNSLKKIARKKHFCQKKFFEKKKKQIQTKTFFWKFSEVHVKINEFHI